MTNKTKSLRDKLKEKIERSDSPHSILMGARSAPEETQEKNDAPEGQSNPTIEDNAKEEDKTSTQQPTRKPKESGEARKPRKPQKEKKESEFRRKAKMKETHDQKTNYVHKDIQKVMDIVCAWGESYKFLNVALRDFIVGEENIVEYLEENDPELLERVRNISYH